MPTKNKKRTASQAFINLLVDEVPKFDEMIMADIRPQDGWIGHIGPVPPRMSLWNRILTWIALKLALLSKWLMPVTKKVRKRVVPMGTPVEMTQDRFRAVWPNTASNCKRMTKKKPRKKK